MDLDFFKKVNDRYGHEAGDTVLIHLAKTIKTQVRATDYVIRDEAMYKANLIMRRIKGDASGEYEKTGHLKRKGLYNIL